MNSEREREREREREIDLRTCLLWFFLSINRYLENTLLAPLLRVSRVREREREREIEKERDVD